MPKSTLVELACNAVVFYPILDCGRNETPELADADPGNLTSVHHALQGSRMNSEKLCRLIAVEQSLCTRSENRRCGAYRSDGFSHLRHCIYPLPAKASLPDRP